jgi:hypothetical protein
MRWKSSSRVKNGCIDLIFADWYKAKCSGSMHSTSGFPRVGMYSGGMPESSLLLGGGNNRLPPMVLASLLFLRLSGRF